MIDVKTIGGVGGIFHIFVPGLFLLLNFVAGTYFLPWTTDEMKGKIAAFFSNPSAGIVLSVALGYLIGVLLRIFRSEAADQWSAWFLQTFVGNTKQPKSSDNLYKYEAFPYVQWVGVLAESLPADVRRFYSTVWAKKRTSKHRPSTFLNYCKICVISADERAANEIYAAEALCRYISGMLYALLAAFGILYSVLLSRMAWPDGLNLLVSGVLLAYPVAAVRILRNPSVQRVKVVCIVLAALYARLFSILLSRTDRTDTLDLLLGAVLVGYIIAIGGILCNYRFVRIKEVYTVFFASYKNKRLFVEDTDLTPVAAASA